MNKFHEEKIGDRTAPEFDEEAIVFVHMDVLLLQFENCSQKQNAGTHVHGNVCEESSMREQTIEEWNGVDK